MSAASPTPPGADMMNRSTRKPIPSGSSRAALHPHHPLRLAVVHVVMHCCHAFNGDPLVAAMATGNSRRRTQAGRGGGAAPIADAATHALEHAACERCGQRCGQRCKSRGDPRATVMHVSGGRYNSTGARKTAFGCPCAAFLHRRPNGYRLHPQRQAVKMVRPTDPG